MNKIEETRNTIKAALSTETTQHPTSTAALEKRIENVENENKQLKADLAGKSRDKLCPKNWFISEKHFLAMQERYAALEARLSGSAVSPKAAAPKPTPAPAQEEEESDDDVE